MSRELLTDLLVMTLQLMPVHAQTIQACVGLYVLWAYNSSAHERNLRLHTYICGYTTKMFS